MVSPEFHGDPGEELAQVEAAANAANLNIEGHEALTLAIEEFKESHGMSPKNKLPWRQLVELAKEIAQTSKYVNTLVVIGVALVYVDQASAFEQAGEGACKRIGCINLCREASAKGLLRMNTKTMVQYGCYCYRSKSAGGQVWHAESADGPWDNTGISDPWGQ